MSAFYLKWNIFGALGCTQKERKWTQKHDFDGEDWALGCGLLSLGKLKKHSINTAVDGTSPRQSPPSNGQVIVL